MQFCGYINNSLHLARKYARVFVRGRYLEEQIMSKDKYPSLLKTVSLDNAIREFSLAEPSWVI